MDRWAIVSWPKLLKEVYDRSIPSCFVPRYKKNDLIGVKMNL